MTAELSQVGYEAAAPGFAGAPVGVGIGVVGADDADDAEEGLGEQAPTITVAI